MLKAFLRVLLVIFVRLIVTKDQTILQQVQNFEFNEVMATFKSYFMGSTLVKIPKETLEEYSQYGYVDSPVYHDGVWLVRKLNWAKLAALLNLLPSYGGRILDFGCGNGVMLPTFSKLFDEVFGIDLHVRSASGLVKDYQLENVELRNVNAYYLPFWDNMFDVVWASSALEHFQDVDAAIFQIKRVLKPGGILLFLSPSENWFYHMGRKICGYEKPKDHYHTAKEIEKLLDLNFTPEVKKSFPFWGMPVYRLGRYRKHGSN